MMKQVKTVIFLFVLIFVFASLAQAQSDVSYQMKAESQTFDIEAQSLPAALKAYERITGIKLEYSDEIVEGRKTNGVRGTNSLAKALERILTGTGLSYTINAQGAIALQKVEEEKAAERPAMELEKMVVTATKTEIAVKDAPASVTVITADEIIKSGAKSFTQLLEKVPGSLIANDYGDGMTGSVLFRGHRHYEAAGFTNILIDGMPIVSSWGSAQFSLIPLGNIKRIEIVKGPSASLWGPYGVGGTINVITKVPKKSEAQLSSKIGENSLKSHSFYGQSIGKEGWAKDLGIALSAESKSSDGWRENSQYDMKNYWLKLTKPINDLDADMELIISSTKDNVGWPGAISEEMWNNNDLYSVGPSSYYNHGKSGVFDKLNYYMLKFNKKIGNFQNIKINLNYMDQDYNYRLGDYYKFSNNKVLNGGLKYEITWERHSILIGTEISNGSIDNTNLPLDEAYDPDWSAYEYPRSKEDSDEDKQAFYCQYTRELTESLTGNISGRWDKVEYKGNGYRYNWGDTVETRYSDDYNEKQTSSKASLMYNLNKNLNVYGSMGTGFTPPSPYELYVSEYANPNLLPAKSLCTEIGVKGFYSNIAGSLCIFYDKTKNFLKWDYAGYKNIGETSHKGLESSIEYWVSPNFAVNLNADYIFVKIEEGEEGTQDKYLSGVPKYNIKLDLDYTHHAGFFTLISGKQVGPWYFDDTNEFKYKGHFLADTKIGYKRNFGRNEVKLTLGCDNIFNKKWATGTYAYYGSKSYYPGMERAFYAQFDIKF